MRPATSTPSEFDCAICFKLLVMPTTTACGHTFCEVCLRMAQQANPVCPLCREPLLGGRRPNVALTNLIKRNYPIQYQEREEEIASSLSASQINQLQQSRTQPIILLTHLDASVLNQLVYSLPGDVVVVHAMHPELLRQLGVARSLSEDLGIVLPFSTLPLPQSHQESGSSPSGTTTMFGMTVRVEVVQIRRRDSPAEALVQFHFIARWKKELNEGEELNAEGFVFVQPFYDAGWDPETGEGRQSSDGTLVRRHGERNILVSNTRDSVCARYCALVQELNEEVEKHRQLSGIAGSETFQRLYGPVPQATNRQVVTAKEIETSSFFYARVFRVPLFLRSRWFHLRDSLVRMEEVLAHVRAKNSPYSLLVLTDRANNSIEWKSWLDSILNNLVLVSSILLVFFLIGVIISPPKPQMMPYLGVSLDRQSARQVFHRYYDQPRRPHDRTTRRHSGIPSDDDDDDE